VGAPHQNVFVGVEKKGGCLWGGGGGGGGGCPVQSTTGSRGVGISSSNGSNVGYTMFWGRVQDPLHSHVSPSLPLPCVTVCHQVSFELLNKALN